MDHHHAIERAEQQQPRLQADLQRVGRLAQDAAQHLRTDRQAFGVEGRLAREHAEALAEQVQRETRARFVAQRDVAQHRLLVHRFVVDQAEVAEGGLLHPGHAQARRGLRVAHAGERGFQADQVTRDEVGAIQAQGAQRFHVPGLDAGIARVVGEAEQLLLGLVEHLREMARHLVGYEAEEVFHDPAHATGQVGRGQGRRWRVGAGQVERNRHRTLARYVPG